MFKQMVPSLWYWEYTLYNTTTIHSVTHGQQLINTPKPRKRRIYNDRKCGRGDMASQEIILNFQPKNRAEIHSEENIYTMQQILCKHMASMNCFLYEIK
jgi:hypothetical protein